MGLYKYHPVPSDRMGALWTLLPIKGGCILEFGTAGTTRFALNAFAKMQGEQNSKIYSTHLDEADIAMGDVRCLDKAIDEIISLDNPAAIFVMPSTLSSVIGTDIEAHCRSCQKKYPYIKIIPVKSDGFKGNWTLGVKDTLEMLVCNFAGEGNKTEAPSFNIIGSCADDYNYYSDSCEIVRMLTEGFGAKALCVMTSDIDISDMKTLGRAHINLVLREEGAAAARFLNKKFGTPYLVGRPYGLQSTLKWMEQISEILKLKYNKEFVKDESDLLSGALRAVAAQKGHIRNGKIAIGGHYDVVEGIIKFIREEVGYTLSEVWCSSPDRAGGDIPFYDEHQWEAAVLKGDYNILMSNAIALKLAKENCKKIQIDIPNYQYSLIKYKYLPYVGFRGAMYLLSRLVNP